MKAKPKIQKSPNFILIEPYRIELKHDSSNNIEHTGNTITNLTDEWVTFKV